MAWNSQGLLKLWVGATARANRALRPDQSHPGSLGCDGLLDSLQLWALGTTDLPGFSFSQLRRELPPGPFLGSSGEAAVERSTVRLSTLQVGTLDSTRCTGLRAGLVAPAACRGGDAQGRFGHAF